MNLIPLLVGIAIGILICYQLGYYDHLLARLRAPVVGPEYLSCGQCFWLDHRCGISPLPPLPDQLVISPWCNDHNGFSWKRWGEKHLDDKGLSSDVDNYRGFLEGD